MKYQKGFKFMDYFTDYEIIEFMEQYKMYRLNNLTDNRQNELKEEEEIDHCVIMKEVFISRREENRIFLEKQEERERVENEKKEAQEKEFNFCYGYVDNKSDIQRGKILKILNTKELFNGIVRTRKNVIENTITNNTVTLETYNNINRYSSHKVCLTYKKLADKIEYRLLYNDMLLEVTKTEYDYAAYLIDNELIQGIA